MCSPESSSELTATCKSRNITINRLGVLLSSRRRKDVAFRCPRGAWETEHDPVNICRFPPPAASDSALILELKTRRPPSLEGRAGCETWSVDFSPDGAWFAWSMGHGIVWVVAWPLDSE